MDFFCYLFDNLEGEDVAPEEIFVDEASASILRAGSNVETPHNAAKLPTFAFETPAYEFRI